MKRKKSRGGLVKKLLLTGILAGASILNVKGQVTEEAGFKAAMNPYSQPNMHILEGRHSLDYYGSGDVNKDNVINLADAQLIRNGTESGNDRADVNGDEVVNNVDATIIEDYVSGTLSRLPGDWNHSNRQERIDWYLRENNTKGTGKVDKTDEKPYISGYYSCGDFATEGASINFFGIENLENWVYYDRFSDDGDQNARFNMPLYRVGTRTTSTPPVGHYVIGFLAGPESGERYAEDPTNFSHWVFFEPQVDIPVEPGDWSMNENEYVQIEWIGYSPTNDIFPVRSLITFNLENGEVSSFTKHPYLLLTNPNAPDTEAPTADFPDDKTVSSPSPNSLENIILATPPTNVEDNMDPNPVVSYTYTSTQTSNGSCSDVSYDVDVNWNIVDNAGNDTSHVQKISFLDDVNPEVTGIPDDRNVEYSEDLIPENYVVLNDLTATDNSGLEVLLEKSRSSTQVMDGSVNQVRFTDIDTIKATDQCGNDTTYLVKQEIDDTQPGTFDIENLNVEVKEADYTSVEDHINLINKEDNSNLPLEEIYNSYLIESNNSYDKYEVDVSVEDIAGNISDIKTAYLTVNKPTGINDVTGLENTISIYPNPATNTIYFESEIFLTKIRIFDIDGKLILESNFKQAVNVSNIMQGVYIIGLYTNNKEILKKKVVIQR